MYKLSADIAFSRLYKQTLHKLANTSLKASHTNRFALLICCNVFIDARKNPYAIFKRKAQ